MYYSSDEARSDLILSAAVFVVGPIIVDFLSRTFGLDGASIVGLILAIVMPVVYTVLVPFLLIRYRKQRLSEFGFTGSLRPMLSGFLVSAPVAVAGIVSGFLSSGELSGSSPLLNGILFGEYLQVLARLLSVLGLTLLAVYCTVLAREAFRGEPAYLRSATLQIGRYVGIAAAVATLLLLASFAGGGAGAGLATLILQPVGVTGAVALALRLARGSRLTTRPVLITPMVLFAIGSFSIFANPTQIVFSIWSAALLAGLGLAVALLVESQRSAWGPLGLGLVLALLTYLPA